MSWEALDGTRDGSVVNATQPMIGAAAPARTAASVRAPAEAETPALAPADQALLNAFVGSDATGGAAHLGWTADELAFLNSVNNPAGTGAAGAAGGFTAEELKIIRETGLGASFGLGGPSAGGGVNSPLTPEEAQFWDQIRTKVRPRGSMLAPTGTGALQSYTGQRYAAPVTTGYRAPLASTYTTQPRAALTGTGQVNVGRRPGEYVPDIRVTADANGNLHRG